jgi:Chemotaxis phosphatase CheX
MSATPVSKVLILDESPEHLQSLKRFCDQAGLVGLKARRSSILSVLRTNIDLGAILLAENYADSIQDTAHIALEIHGARPELPLIMRREAQATLEDLPEPVQRAVCAAYVASDMDALHRVIQERVFCLTYPNALLRGIAEIIRSVLGAQFPSTTILVGSHYIVHDRVIQGELFSLMYLESSWCRGYMMLQAEEEPLLALAGQVTEKAVGARGFRALNDLVSETTNLIWGAFKNRFLGNPAAPSSTRVPMIVNHKHKYISFGTQNPQLCFRINLTNTTTWNAATLYARFIFNLDWAPEQFQEVSHKLEGLMDAGELELF